MRKKIILLFLVTLVVGSTISVTEGKENKSTVQARLHFHKTDRGVDSEESHQVCEGDPWEEKLISDVRSYLNYLGPPNSTHGSEQRINRADGPVIASTKEEIGRLKAAWASSGTQHEVLARRFANADKAIEAGVVFPPEGGQHNQWYQCESCQMGLKTIDANHHQCPSCKQIYSGFPYDNVLYNSQHRENINRAEDAAWAWIITGEPKYQEFATEVLLGYADRYLSYPMLHTRVNDKTIDVEAGKKDKYRTAGRLHAQTLTEANSLIPAAVTYDLIYTSLSEKERRHIEKNFINAIAESINVHKTGKSNWQTWHNAALLYAGAVMGDGALVKQALLDEEHGFIAQMKISILPEGMWYENSWGYHYYTLSAMTYLAEGARRLGFDLYSFPLLEKMYLLAFDYLMNDGSLPRFGDAVQDSPLGKRVNEQAYAAYKDDRLLAGLPSEVNWDGIALGREESKRSELPRAKSKLIPGSGHAILATDGPGKLTAALTFAPFGGFHGHFDKLSFVWFGYGEELGVDAGRSASQAYRLPIHSEWYRSTTAHNAVIVDGVTQQEADGNFLAFNSTDSYAAVTADAGSAYENVSHTRFLLLSPDYLLIVDELKPHDEGEHIYDWLYHNKGQKISTTLSKDGSKLGEVPVGYTYLQDVTSYKSTKEQPISLQFIGDNTNVYLTMTEEEGDEVFTATGPQKSIEDRVPMVIVRRKGNTVRFATVLEPVPSMGKPKVKNLNFLEGHSLEAIVVYEGGEDRISFPSTKLDHFTVEQKTDSGLKMILSSEDY